MGKGKLKNLKNGRKMYDDDPGCKYLVVECPWPNCSDLSKRDSSWYNHVGAWLYYATNKAFQPDELFHLGTRYEVIVRYSDKLDVSRLLGEHDWRKATKESANRSSYIFEYDYGMKGHPDDHQWQSHPFEDFSKNVGLQNDELPIRQPYPPPTWADCRGMMRSCKDLALPMPVDKPKAREEAVALPVEDTPPTTTEKESARRPQPRSIFSGLADHLPERPTQGTRDVPADDPSRPRPGQLYTGKLDPDDEDAVAAALLKSEPRDVKVPLVKIEAGLVKSEAGYDPSPEVVARYEAWRRSRESQSTGVKQEPGHGGTPLIKVEPGTVKSELAEADVPSEEVLRLHAEYERRRSDANGSRIPGNAGNTSSQRVKPEQGVEPRLPSSVDAPIIKQEHTDIRIKSEPNVLDRPIDPRRNSASGRSITQGLRTAVKREADDIKSEELRKRIKTE